MPLVVPEEVQNRADYKQHARPEAEDFLPGTLLLGRRGLRLIGNHQRTHFFASPVEVPRRRLKLAILEIRTSLLWTARSRASSFSSICTSARSSSRGTKASNTVARISRDASASGISFQVVGSP